MKVAAAGCKNRSFIKTISIRNFVHSCCPTVIRVLWLDNTVVTVLTSCLVVNFTRLTYGSSSTACSLPAVVSCWLETRMFVLTVNGEKDSKRLCELPEWWDSSTDLLRLQTTVFNSRLRSVIFLTLLCFLCLSSNYFQITKSVKELELFYCSPVPTGML